MLWIGVVQLSLFSLNALGERHLPSVGAPFFARRGRSPRRNTRSIRETGRHRRDFETAPRRLPQAWLPHGGRLVLLGRSTRSPEKLARNSSRKVVRQCPRTPLSTRDHGRRSETNATPSRDATLRASRSMSEAERITPRPVPEPTQRGDPRLRPVDRGSARCATIPRSEKRIDASRAPRFPSSRARFRPQARAVTVTPGAAHPAAPPGGGEARRAMCAHVVETAPKPRDSLCLKGLVALARRS